jgi:hypothetical protein
MFPVSLKLYYILTGLIEKHLSLYKLFFPEDASLGGDCTF